MIESNIENFYKDFGSIVHGNTIDLSNIILDRLWKVGVIAQLCIGLQGTEKKEFLFPKNADSILYLQRMKFSQLLLDLSYADAAHVLTPLGDDQPEVVNIQGLLRCQYKDEVTGRIDKFKRKFQEFGMSEDDAARAAALVGELGNNVFDHNLGNWPTNFTGALIATEHDPDAHRIEVIVGDAGIGFFGSLRHAYPEVTTDILAIRKGLAGFTGRVPEDRGNGLKFIQNWTINLFRGTVRIHSGAGLVQVSHSGMEERAVPRIIGTLAQFVLYYR